MPRSQKWKQRRVGNADGEQVNAGGGFSDIRAAYEQLGADKFYAAHGETYSNPHGHVLEATLSQALDGWAASGVLDVSRFPWRVLDLACGGGEASSIIDSWCRTQGCATASGSSSASGGKRKARADDVVEACVHIDACDPYTGSLYESKTGRRAESWSFADVAAGVLELEPRPPYDIVVASFCLHLLEPATLRATLAALARSARLLLVATPHKRGLRAIKENSSWAPVVDAVVGADTTVEGAVRHRVRAQLFKAPGS
jgi:SAM-dependent methyltransferase